jgi:trehalose 6-phosphate phosphatase
MAIPWTNAWEEIAARFAAPPRLLVACDFDGTLAPLVSDPDKVKLPSAALDALRRLQSAPGVSLGIISGRSLADLIPRIPLSNVTIAGNHGLEIRGLGLDGERCQATALKPRLKAVALHLEDAIGGVPGILIENKQLSLTIHLRNVIPSHLEWVIRYVREAGAKETGLRLQEGHMVLELLPAIAWDKGAAVCQIAARLGLPRSAVFYIGDDTTDESAFSALPNGLSVRVGPAPRTAARWTASDPAEVHVLLDRLAAVREKVRALPASGARRILADS